MKSKLFITLLLVVGIIGIVSFTAVKSTNATFCTDDECNAPTPTPFHLGCKENTCVKKPGKGTNTCRVNSFDCIPHHSVCRKNSCVVVIGGGVNKCETSEDCQPELTPTPTATPSPTIAPCSPGQPFSGPFCGWSPSPENPSTTNAPGQPSCTVNFDAPKVQGFKIDKTKGIETYSWWNSIEPGITQLSAVWGYAPGDERFGLVSLGGKDKNGNYPTRLDIPGLDLSKTSWFQVWAWKGQCVEKSNWFN